MMLLQAPGHLIRRAYQISGSLFAANLAGYDLTSVQYATMTAVAAQPGIDATRISDLIAFDKATLGGVLDRLEAKGLIARTPAQHDRRAKAVSLTPRGQALLAEVEDKVAKAQSDMLAPLDEAEQRIFMDLLKKFIGQAPRRAVEPEG